MIKLGLPKPDVSDKEFQVTKEGAFRAVNGSMLAKVIGNGLNANVRIVASVRMNRISSRSDSSGMLGSRDNR